MKSAKVTIVVPVYADWPSLSDCIESLKRTVDPKHSIIFVNDCGPEADLLERRIKEAITGYKNYKYFRNPQNLGFVKTCNRTVTELDKSNYEILLLNSDTVTTDGFLEEMLAVLYSQKNIGVVSPRSNNATIATVPLSAISEKGIDPSQSYKSFQELKSKLPRYSEVPTAHGFCMLIRRSLIKKYGLFDTVFGKGYGEEVDFCQRIKKHGYISVLSNRSYVFHLEAKSFTIETKTKMLEKNNQIIRSRYPEYQKQVREYIKRALDAEEGIGSNSSAGRLLQRLTTKFKSKAGVKN